MALTEKTLEDLTYHINTAKVRAEELSKEFLKLVKNLNIIQKEIEKTEYFDKLVNAVDQLSEQLAMRVHTLVNETNAFERIEVSVDEILQDLREEDLRHTMDVYTR